ncbi:hypothetical protein D9757_010507 [Collybiopsis confluens]|nr:hypothetical protein D9757_010507 [Collybiopsis confluens]
MDRFSSLLFLFPSLNCLRLRLPDDCEQSMLSAVLRTLVIRDQLCTTDSESGIIVPRLVEFELAIVGTNERREFPSEMIRMILSRSSSSSSHVSSDRPKFSRLEKVTLRGFGSSDDMTMLSGLSDLHLTVEPGSVHRSQMEQMIHFLATGAFNFSERLKYAAGSSHNQPGFASKNLAASYSTSSLWPFLLVLLYGNYRLSIDFGSLP